MGQQQAKCLLCISTSKAIDHHLGPSIMRKAFNQKPVWLWEATDLALQVQPFARMGGQFGPVFLLKHAQDALTELG